MAKVTWSNADLKAGNNLLLVPGQGAGTVIVPDLMFMVMNYGGTNAWTSNPATSLLSNGVTMGGLTTATWTDVFTKIIYVAFPSYNGQNTNVENGAISLHLSAAPTGNAAGDNTVTVFFYYKILNI